MIRPAALDDASAVFGLLEQLAVSYPPDRGAFDNAFPRLVSDKDALLLVDDTDGLVRGYALVIVSLLLHTNGRSGQLQELVVDVDSRGTGVGSALLQAVEAQCRARQVKQLTVASRRAAGFYEARGYGTTADYLKRVL